MTRPEDPTATTEVEPRFRTGDLVDYQPMEGGPVERALKVRRRWRAHYTHAVWIYWLVGYAGPVPEGTLTPHEPGNIDVAPPDVEDRIKCWREQEPGDEDETYVELLCDAEEELRGLRAALTGLYGAVSDFTEVRTRGLASEEEITEAWRRWNDARVEAAKALGMVAAAGDTNGGGGR